MSDDLEHCICDEGISDGYTFDQNDSLIVITFPVPDCTVRSSIVCDISCGDRSIEAGVSFCAPAVCGTMFGSVFNPQVDVFARFCRVRLTKSAPSDWPVFISAPSSRGIDPKSLFMLGVLADAAARPRHAWSRFVEAADRGYVPAQMLLACCLLNDTNPYQVPRDVARGIAILEAIPPNRLTDDVRVALAGALTAGGRGADARAVLAGAAPTCIEAKLKLVEMLDDQVQIVEILEDLVRRRSAVAAHKLAGCYAAGRGVRKDPQRARELSGLACGLDKDLEPVVVDQAIGANMLTTGAAIVLFIGVFVGMWIFAKKRGR
jgi:hypothetical protein